MKETLLKTKDWARKIVSICDTIHDGEAYVEVEKTLELYKEKLIANTLKQAAEALEGMKPDWYEEGQEALTDAQRLLREDND